MNTETFYLSTNKLVEVEFYAVDWTLLSRNGKPAEKRDLTEAERREIEHQIDQCLSVGKDMYVER